MSTRFYYRRGQKVEVEQLDDVVAMPVSEEAGAVSDEPELPAALAADTPEAPMAKHDARAFHRAGWALVEVTQSDTPAGAGEAAAEEESAPVFRDAQDGRLLIGTRRITVKFKQDLPPAEVEQRLAA